MKNHLSKLERVPLREAWKHEANDFTPWQADLKLVATEHWVGDFKSGTSAGKALA
jgi:hypothetical protein